MTDPNTGEDQESPLTIHHDPVPSTVPHPEPAEGGEAEPAPTTEPQPEPAEGARAVPAQPESPPDEDQRNSQK